VRLLESFTFVGLLLLDRNPVVQRLYRSSGLGLDMISKFILNMTVAAKHCIL
jgi:hypothetical protein